MGLSALLGGGGSQTAFRGGGGSCTGANKPYTAVRFAYAKNAQTVTHVLGESWCWDGVSPCEIPLSYQITWAREFRYDGARARYMNRPLNVSTLGLNPQPHPTQPTIWTDYDGDETYGDFTIASGNPPTITPGSSYQPGLWRKAGTTAEYLHNDHLGTLRNTTGTAGAVLGSDVFTAFGERIAGTADRHGYVGAFGYQSTLDATGAEAFPFQHVGARYYDPASGRFLQRDPIGIRGGANVYSYTSSEPTGNIDPSGLSDTGWPSLPYNPPPPPGPPPPESPQDIGKHLRDINNARTAVKGAAAIGAIVLTCIAPEVSIGLAVGLAINQIVEEWE